MAFKQEHTQQLNLAIASFSNSRYVPIVVRIPPGLLAIINCLADYILDPVTNYIRCRSLLLNIICYGLPTLVVDGGAKTMLKATICTETIQHLPFSEYMALI